MLDTIYGYVPDWALGWLPGGDDYQNRTQGKKLLVWGAAAAGAYYLLKRK